MLRQVSNASWIDDVLYKNPILLWLGRRGWFDQGTLTVPLARKQLAERLKRQRQDETKGGADQGPVDLLTKFFQAKQDFPETVDDRAVLGLTMSMVNAGSGTIATTLIALFYYLLKTPEKMTKLRTELDSHFPPPPPPPTTDSVSIQSFEEYVVPFGPAQKLPYLDACIKETLRIHPALFGQLMERVVPPEGATIAGEFVPGGTIVSSNAWIVQRHKPTYGADVDTYRPERWLECDSQQLSAMNRALLVWGAGAHTCIGKNIGLLELYKVVPSILRMFTVEAVNPGATLKIYNIGEAEPYDFYVRLKPRYGRVMSEQ
jgi:cytochrome P450